MLDLLLPMASGQPSSGRQVTTGGDYGWIGPGLPTYGQKTRAGVTIDNESAMTNAAALCATRLIAEGVGGLPKPLYRRKSDEEREVANLPVAGLMKFPNHTMTATPFWESRTAHQVNWDGGAFSEIEFSPGSDRVKALWPIHPSRVIRSRDPKYQYQVRNNDGSYASLYAWEMLHIPGIIPWDGIWSMGLVSYGRETIGGAIGVDRASWAFLGSGGQPKGMLMAPGMGGQDKREVRAAFRKEWEEVHGNPEINVPTIAILGAGFEYKPLDMLGGESNQLVQSRAMNKADIPTLYNVPAYRIPGCESKETAGTVEQRAIDFVVSSLMPWIRKQEEQCSFKLLNDAQRLEYYFEYNVSGLLRGDQTARYNSYRVGITTGFLTINQVCRLENLQPIGPAGDEHYLPANLITAEQMAAGMGGQSGPPGSDHSGSPADSPHDKKPLAKLPKAVEVQLAALEKALPDRPVDYREGARIALTDVLARLLTKESNAAQTAMKGKGDFDGWLREFYSRHEPLVAEALGSACWNLRAAGAKQWGEPAELAAWLKARNVEALQRTYNSDTPETAAKRLRAWPTDRAKELADEILGAA